MTKIRIISDVHYDLNRSYPDFFNFSKQKDIVTLIAGDIAGSIEDVDLFLNKYFDKQSVIFISGNHDVYNDKHLPLAALKKEQAKMYPKYKGNWHYLENDWMFVPGTRKSVAVIGCVLYTDYTYSNKTLDEFNSEQKATYDTINSFLKNDSTNTSLKKLTQADVILENKFAASQYLNDFKWGYNENFMHLTPNDYLRYHNESKNEILRCYNEIMNINENTYVILMTHHCISPKCIGNSFIKSTTNASYVSDMEDWVSNNFKNIKLVISGHVHQRFDFTFGKNNTRYIVNPCGYIKYNEPFLEPEFNKELIIDI